MFEDIFRTKYLPPEGRAIDTGPAPGRAAADNRGDSRSLAAIKPTTLDRLLLDALRSRLDVDAVHLSYGVSIGMREISLSSGPTVPLFESLSPYEWQGSCLPRSYRTDTGYITESVFFGDMGSASRLRIGHRQDPAELGEQLIIEHCKLHAALEDSFNERIKDCRLSSAESTALYWGARGFTAKETAREMGMNFRSIEYLLKNAKSKLGAQSLPEAIHKAVCTRQLKR